ncbi:MAG: CvpA family protein [Armatimonadetes bacterium]|nr:CvpA family protein [Armatimonadota bacterium]
MTWFDGIAIILILLIAWAESVRGFGRAIFDFVGGLIALKMADVLSKPLAEAAPILQPEAHAQAWWMAVLFLVFVVLIIIATKFIYETTLLSLDVLDPIVGGLLGIASGILVAHVFIRVLLVAYADTEFGTIILNSFIGQEIIVFRSYHNLVEALQNLGNW